MPEKKETKMGRPKTDNPKTERLFIRVTKQQKEKIFKIAEKKGKTVTDLILDAIDKTK